MKKLLYIICLVTNANTYAQSPPYYYQSVFGTAGRGNAIQSINSYYGNFILNTQNYIIGTPSVIDLRLIDNTGVILKNKTISFPNKTIASWKNKLAINPQDSSVYIAGQIGQDYYGTSATNWQGFLFKLNKDLDTLWHKSFTNPIGDSAIKFIGCEALNNSIISFGTSMQYDSYGDCFLLKTDFNGNEISRKTFQTANEVGGFLKLHQNKDKSLIALQFIMYPNTDTNIKVIKMDTLFNIVWQQTYFTPYADYQSDIVETADSNFVLCNGYTIQMLSGVMGTPVSKANLKKINKNNGAVMWDKNYGKAINFNNLLTVQELPNTHLMAIGQKVTPYVGQKPTGATVSYVLTTDANGDSLNYQTVFSDSSTADHRLFDFCAIPDGYFFGGTTRVTGSAYEYNWLIKSDTAGCFYANCKLNTGINEIDKLSFSVYPNPAKDIVYLSNQNEDAVIIKLYDVLGSLILEKNSKELNIKIDVSNYATGTYILRVLKNNTISQIKLIVNH